MNSWISAVCREALTYACKRRFHEAFHRADLKGFVCQGCEGGVSPVGGAWSTRSHKGYLASCPSDSYLRGAALIAQLFLAVVSLSSKLGVVSSSSNTEAMLLFKAGDHLKSQADAELLGNLVVFVVWVRETEYNCIVSGYQTHSFSKLAYLKVHKYVTERWF